MDTDLCRVISWLMEKMEGWEITLLDLDLLLTFSICRSLTLHMCTNTNYRANQRCVELFRARQRQGVSGEDTGVLAAKKVLTRANQSCVELCRSVQRQGVSGEDTCILAAIQSVVMLGVEVSVGTRGRSWAGPQQMQCAANTTICLFTPHNHL